MSSSVECGTYWLFWFLVTFSRKTWVCRQLVVAHWVSVELEWIRQCLIIKKMQKRGASSCCSRTYRFIKRLFELAWEFRILIMIVDRWSCGKHRAGQALKFSMWNLNHCWQLIQFDSPDPISELSLLPAHLQDISEASFTPRSTNNKWQRWCGLATHANSSARIIKQQIIQLALNPPPVRPVISAKQMRTHRVNRNRKKGLIFCQATEAEIFSRG